MAAQQTVSQNQHRDFSVAIIGAENNDQITLSRIFGITRYRTRRYDLTSVSVELTPEAAYRAARHADIFIVNINNPKAILLWSRMSGLFNKQERRPVIRLTRAKQVNSQPDLTIAWPINPAKVLHTLDNYTINHLDFIPELTIGSETESCRQTLEKIAVFSARQATPPPEQAKKIRALVADDSLAVRRQLNIEFSMLGSELDLVEDGEAAVKAAETQSYDIIFLDVIMPGMDGYAVCKHIRKTSFNKDTPVVLLTSKSSKFDKLKGMLAGCDTYLTKPINHNEFTDITRKHLSKMEQYNDSK